MSRNARIFLWALVVYLLFVAVAAFGRADSPVRLLIQCDNLNKIQRYLQLWSTSDAVAALLQINKENPIKGEFFSVCQFGNQEEWKGARRLVRIGGQEVYRLVKESVESFGVWYGVYVPMQETRQGACFHDPVVSHVFCA